MNRPRIVDCYREYLILPTGAGNTSPQRTDRASDVPVYGYKPAEAGL
jgi:hypothetical protein